MRLYDLAVITPWAIQEQALQQVLEIVSGATRGVDLEALAARMGRPLDNSREATIRDNIAIVPVVGVISRRANMLSECSGGTSLDVLTADIFRAVDNDQITAIVLEIDSPGGEAAGVGELADLIYLARDQKPIIAYSSGMIASAAYWIASAAEEIVTHPSAQIGSVGVVMAYTDRKGMDDRMGIKRHEFVSSQSPYKRADTDTDEGRALMQKRVDDMATVMIESIARNRALNSASVIKNFGQGQVLIAGEALENGMIDRFGSLESLIAEMAGVVGTASLSAAYTPTSPGLPVGT